MKDLLLLWLYSAAQIILVYLHYLFLSSHACSTGQLEDDNIAQIQQSAGKTFCSNLHQTDAMPRPPAGIQHHFPEQNKHKDASKSFTFVQQNMQFMHSPDCHCDCFGVCILFFPNHYRQGLVLIYFHIKY